MKHLLTISAVVAALVAQPVAAQTLPPEETMPVMTSATSAEPVTDPATPVVIQANPRGEGMATMTPPNPVVATEPVAPAMPADPNYHAGPYKGALTPPPPEAMGKVYPVCTRTLQDNCRNRGGV